MKNLKLLNSILTEDLKISSEDVYVIYDKYYKNYKVIQYNEKLHYFKTMYRGNHKNVKDWLHSYFSEENLKKIREIKELAREEYIKTGFLKNNCITASPDFDWKY